MSCWDLRVHVDEEQADQQRGEGTAKGIDAPNAIHDRPRSLSVVFEIVRLNSSLGSVACARLDYSACHCREIMLEQSKNVWLQARGGI